MNVLAGAPPPVVQFFVRRVISWVVLTSACALPLMILTWSDLTPIERFGEALGVFVWVVAMVIAGERLRWPSSHDARTLAGALQSVVWNRWTSREADRRSAMLRTGALVTAIVYGCLAIFAGPLGLLLWFAPAVWIGSGIGRIANGGPDFWPAFGWTVICGAQTAIVVWLCGLATHRGKGPTA